MLPPSRVAVLSVDGRRLSVCLSVYLSIRPVPDPKSRCEWRRKLKIAGTEAMTRVTRDPI